MKEFIEAWDRLNAEGKFNDQDRKLAKLFFDIGTTAILQRVRDSIEPFVDSINETN